MFKVQHHGPYSIVTRLFDSEEWMKDYASKVNLPPGCRMSVDKEFEYRACDRETREKFLPSKEPGTVVIRDPAHFAYTVNFARQNDLLDEFGRKFADLMHLLRDGGEIYPDGYTDPDFGWRGCGMVGGFIFHRLAREWSIHT